MNSVKTRHGFNWQKGAYKEKTLSRSFDTLEEANKFADGKDVVDVYKSRGKIKVEWKKTTSID